ncbi:hypothetical protein JP75_25210 [Devosia riboflavina]|uniref:Uncharacterized protein n=1 Tax=Devosia riboflavina TaxID=46914 RepID=A0A087LSM6_9HYPH|nr:hypothetical protein [Devosia riboflavina]KFL27629.1 hypothetical protein JP75_25210 [Devosia riboflavina]
MTLFRLHRGSLADSMATARTINTKADLVKALDEDGWPHGDIEVKPYGRDDRIGWNTHIVTVDGMAAGFTSGPFTGEQP